MITQSRHARALELDKVLTLLAEHANCEDAKKAALALTPASAYEQAQRMLRHTADAHALTSRYGTPSIYNVKPCADKIGRARVGGMLSMRELLEIGIVLRTARGLIQWKKQAEGETSLDHYFAQLDSHKTLEDDIAACILSEDEISDRASPELADIRRKIRTAGQKARDQLDKMVRSTTYQKYLQEQIVTIRNGRFVVPVKAEYRGEIKGLVHDTSSSGSTLFVEPMAVVEQNNLIRELESKEQHEINRILLALSGQVGESADILQSDYDMIIELDLIFAKTRLADKMRATVPTLLKSGETNLKRARHPLIEANKIVPIDIYLGGRFDTLVITGPNTGGKTVALKTLGLLTLMSLCGLMVPVADGSVVCYYEKVLADIGDEQSIEQSLSTFSGHMRNIVAILEQADKNTLVLIDELGAGTDPVEGAALAVAIISRLRAQGAKIAATTHYAEIKMYALQADGVENACCEFDVATLRPTYRLLIGMPGRSNAFAISERLGLPLDIIAAAKGQVSRDNTRFEDVVSGLEEARQQLEKEKELAEHYRLEAETIRKDVQKARERLEKEQEQELQRAREKARGIVEQVKFQSEGLLKELDELKKQKEREDFSSTVSDVRNIFKAYVRDLENTADPVAEKKQSDYTLPRALQVGDTVLLTEYGSQGAVLALPDHAGMVQVRAGLLNTRVHLSHLQLVEQLQKPRQHTGGVNTRRAVKSAKQDIRSEVDLRGMTTDEALLHLDRYLDSAILSDVKSVTVIHGKGTGALRAAVQQHLKKHRSVKTFRGGVYGEGEAGVTIIELK